MKHLLLVILVFMLSVAPSFGNTYQPADQGIEVVSTDTLSDRGASDGTTLKGSLPLLKDSPHAMQVDREITLSSPSPNPASTFTYFNYNIPFGTGKASLVVRDLSGRIVLEQPVSVNDNRLQLNISDLNNGIFLYSLVLDGRPVITKKLIVSQ